MHFLYLLLVHLAHWLVQVALWDEVSLKAHVSQIPARKPTLMVPSVISQPIKAWALAYAVLKRQAGLQAVVPYVQYLLFNVLRVHMVLLLVRVREIDDAILVVSV